MSRIRVFIVLFVLILIIFIAIFVSDSIITLSGVNNIFKTVKSITYKIYAPLKDLNVKLLPADDPVVVKALKSNFLYPPSSKSYNLTDPEETNPSMGQAQTIDEILDKKRNGFFIECGALDGEIRSNTLFFERERHWSGLLIEADPKNFDHILSKHRKAYASPTCLAPSTHPISVNFQQQINLGHIVGELYNPSGGSELGQILEVQCFPLLSYLKALNVSTVDYFSLDVEGAEFSILKTIPFNKIDIKTLSVEFIHDKEDKSSIELFMRNQGYFLHSEVTNVKWLANDFIFVKKEKPLRRKGH